MRPLHRQAGRQVPDAGLGGVVGSLRLGHIDNGARHAADHDHAARSLALHEVAGDRGGKEVGAVDIDSPDLAHAVDGVVDGLEVLGEPGRGDKIINLAMSLDDLGNTGLDGLGVGNVGKVSRHLGDALGVGVLAAEGLNEQLALPLGFLLCAN